MNPQVTALRTALTVGKRDDFRDAFADVGTSITEGTPLMAAVDWPAAITALDEGSLPASGGERRVLQLAASLADGIPADLRDAFTGMDPLQREPLAVSAVAHAAGLRVSLAAAQGKLARL